MKKPASLRAALTTLIPDLAHNPDRLALWVEKGHIRSRLGTQHGFMWEYDLTVLLRGFTGDPAVPFFVVTQWLRTQQPERLSPGGQNGFAFEVDILDDQTWDVQMVIPLDECVTAAYDDGTWQLTTLTPPDPLDPDGLSLRDDDAPVVSIWHDGTQVAPLVLSA